LTALGPATAVSIAMAAECGPGSQVVLCTDGMANVGLGQLDAYGNRSNESAEQFYYELG